MEKSNIQVQPHLPSQPGLRGHSVADKPEDTLMQRYAVERQTPSGWLALVSHDDKRAAFRDILRFCGQEVEESTYRIFDQFDGKAVLP